MTEDRPLARTEGVLREELGDELLLYDLDADNAVHLNRTAALVWLNCDGQHTVDELVVLVAEKIGEQADEDVVLMALDSLNEQGLIDSGYAERDGAAVALSRRRFFRRVGLIGAAAINAPVVYSALIPPAAAAVSHGHGGGGGGGGGGGVPPDNSQFLNNSSSGNSSPGDSSSGSGPGGPSDGSYP